MGELRLWLYCFVLFLILQKAILVNYASTLDLTGIAIDNVITKLNIKTRKIIKAKNKCLQKCEDSEDKNALILQLQNEIERLKTENEASWRN